MNINEIIKRIDKSEENKTFIMMETIYEDLDLNPYEYDYIEAEKNFYGYWINRFYDMDDLTYRGYILLYFNGKPVALCENNCSDEYNFSWFGQECAEEIKKYLETLKKKKYLDVNIIDINQELEASFDIKLNYNSELLDKDRLYYNNEKVEFVKYIQKDGWKACISDEIIIKLKNGEEKQIKIYDLVVKPRLL